MRALVAAADAALGGVDILVNSAAKPLGQTPPPTLAEVTGALFWDDMNVKVLGYLRCAQAVAPLMIDQGWGRIVNISGLGARSTGAVIGSMRNVAVAAMTKNLADELGPYGINVTVVHPGLTRTEATPGVIERIAAARDLSPAEAEDTLARNSIRRIVDAAEVADVVTFLASPRSVVDQRRRHRLRRRHPREHLLLVISLLEDSSLDRVDRRPRGLRLAGRRST